MRLRIISDGTRGGTRVIPYLNVQGRELEFAGDPIERITKVVWEMDAKSGRANVRLEIHDVEVALEATEGVIVRKTDVQAV